VTPDSQAPIVALPSNVDAVGLFTAIEHEAIPHPVAGDGEVFFDDVTPIDQQVWYGQSLTFGVPRIRDPAFGMELFFGPGEAKRIERALPFLPRGNDL
jgi:hypothetical protein